MMQYFIRMVHLRIPLKYLIILDKSKRKGNNMLLKRKLIYNYTVPIEI